MSFILLIYCTVAGADTGISKWGGGGGGGGGGGSIKNTTYDAMQVSHTRLVGF